MRHRVTVSRTMTLTMYPASAEARTCATVGSTFPLWLLSDDFSSEFPRITRRVLPATIIAAYGDARTVRVELSTRTYVRYRR